MASDDPAARRRGLLVRLTVAPAVLAGVLLLMWWQDRSGTSAPTDAILVVLGAGAAYEAAVMLGKGGAPASVPLAVVASGALSGLGFAFPHDAAARAEARSLIVAATVLFAFLGHFRAAQPGDLSRLLGTLFPVVYVGYLFGLLREAGDGPDGARRLALITVGAKASDIGGWVVGKSIGRHKMIPSVSPGKTWEGTFGGLAFSVGGAVLVSTAVGPLPRLATTTGEAAVLGLLLGVAATVAGVTHSALKRRCAVKDSSTLLPEMGGLLDMIDSLLLAAPVAWLWTLLH